MSEDRKLKIAGRTFSSRLIIGTGKYRSHDEMRRAHDASGAEMVTVAVRRVPLDPNGEVHRIGRRKAVCLPVDPDLAPRFGSVGRRHDRQRGIGVHREFTCIIDSAQNHRL